MDMTEGDQDKACFATSSGAITLRHLTIPDLIGVLKKYFTMFAHNTNPFLVDIWAHKSNLEVVLKQLRKLKFGTENKNMLIFYIT